MPITSILRMGAKGNEVERWQLFLIGRGLLKGSSDGDFGPLTVKASKAGIPRNHHPTPPKGKPFQANSVKRL